MNKVAVIGAGLAGSLLSVFLARRGFEVKLFEARPDFRDTGFAGGRSINLALSDRGLAALKEIGLDGYILSDAVPMHGRMIHAPDGTTKFLPYSGRTGEYINSVSRSGLNLALIREAEKYPNIQIFFNSPCIGVDPRQSLVRFASGDDFTADFILAADGAGSAVRESMRSAIPQMSVEQEFLDYGYKELHIPPAKGDFAMEPNALHIWPRHQYMMIALPNADKSFTCTLFLPYEGVASFAVLKTASDVNDFFARDFPDAVPLMPTLVEDFFTNPTGALGTLRCRPWHFADNVLLLGDAAHAMVPFYGQGMNCAFEDVRILASMIDRSDAARTGVFAEFERLRLPQAEAIQQMAVENFYEMRDATADPVFQRKRQLETLLEQRYPDYFSKYSMVTFREDLPYTVAHDVGNRLDALLMEICRHVQDISQLDIEEVHRRAMATAREAIDEKSATNL